MKCSTFSTFPEATEIPENERKFVEAGRTSINFFDRVLFKWKTTLTVESDPGIHRIYFTNHEDWVSAEYHSSHTQHSATIHSYLGIKLFAELRNNLQVQLDYSLLAIESAADLLADYVVNVLNITECLEQNHGVLESVSTIQTELWKLNEDCFKFEMMRQLVNLHSIPLETPLRELFYDLSKVPSLHHKTTKRFTFFGVDRVEDSPFCWPPTFNFRDRPIAFIEKHLLQYQKVFIQELAKKLDSHMQIGGEFRKTTSKHPYQFFLTLSMAGWEWVVSESSAAVPDQNSVKTSVTFKGTEGELLYKIYSSLMNRLCVPAAIQDKLINGSDKSVTSVASSVHQLLIELRPHKTQSIPPNLTREFWEKTGKFDPRVMKKVFKSSGAPAISNEIIKKNVVNKRGTRKRGAAESLSTPETMAAKSCRQYTRNGRVVSKKRRGAFSSPARGYVAPKWKNCASQEFQELHRVVYRKRFTQNKPFFTQLICHFQQHRHTTKISVVVDKLRETETTRAFFNHLLRGANLNLQISSPKNELFGKLFFDLVPIKHDDYLDKAPSLLRLKLLIDEDVAQTPLTVIEQAIDRLVKRIIEKAGQKAELFDSIKHTLVWGSFSYLGVHLINYLNYIHRNSKSG